MDTSSKTGHSFFRTATFHLALRHAGLLAALSLVMFVLVYLALESSLARRADSELIEDAHEAESNLAGRSDSDGEKAFLADTDPSDAVKECRLLLSPQFKVRVASDLTSWRGFDLVPRDASGIAPGREALRTLSAPESGKKARVIIHRASDGTLIVLGASLADDEVFLGIARNILALGWIAMIVPGLLLGWFMARRAMAGVDRVTATAVQIGTSGLTQRVPVGREGLEIESLAQAFNEMLDRIHLLVRELRDVTSNIAHDLKSPITRIRGMAETTLRSAGGSEQNEHLAGSVIAECDHLADMVDAILELAATDSGVAAPGRAVVDMADVARNAVDLFQPVAEDKGVHLEVHLPPEPLAVRGDLGRVQRVVANLLDNAIKFTERGGVVGVSAEVVSDQVRLSISDSGIGIDSEAIPRIFERFYRGDYSRSAPGHGLGLSLARAIVRAHGGEISVRSAPGEGSVFTIEWPSMNPKSHGAGKMTGS